LQRKVFVLAVCLVDSRKMSLVFGTVEGVQKLCLQVFVYTWFFCELCPKVKAFTMGQVLSQR
jgi:hypothetical protein